MAVGTYITRPAPANKRPAGVHVLGIDYSAPTRTRAGSCVARIKIDAGHHYPTDDHQAAIILVDMQRVEAVDLNYHHSLAQAGDEQGNLSRIKLTLPSGRRLPKKTSAYIILDVFPIYETKLDG